VSSCGRVVSRTPARDSADQPPLLAISGSPDSAWEATRKGVRLRVNLPRGMTTPVRHCPRSCDGPSKASALNPVLSQNARPVSPLSIPTPARDRFVPPCNTFLPVSLWRNSAWQACAGWWSLHSWAVPAFRPLPRWRRFGQRASSHPLLGLITCACWSRVGLRPLHQLTLLLYALAGARWDSRSALSVASCPLAETGRALAVSLARSLILRSRRQAGAPPHPLRAGGDEGSVAVTHALHGMKPVEPTAGGWCFSWGPLFFFFFFFFFFFPNPPWLLAFSLGCCASSAQSWTPAARWTAQPRWRSLALAQIEGLRASVPVNRALGWND